MDYNNSFKPRKSLGALRKTPKTKPKSPDVQGTMKLQRHTLEALKKQFDESDSDEIQCLLAGWFNQDSNGAYLTVELSPRYVSRRQHQRQEEPTINMFDMFQHQEDVH
jgi:hypothetical protein